MRYINNPTVSDLAYLGDLLQGNALDTVTLRFGYPLKTDQVLTIKNITSLHPEKVNLLFTEDLGDFGFLRSLPHIAGLSLCFFGEFDFDYLSSFSNLKGLRLSLINNRPISLKKYQPYLENIETFVSSNTLKEKNYFANFKKLKNISISYNHFDLQTLEELKKIEKISMYRGRLINFDRDIQVNSSLQYLSLKLVTNIESIDFVSKLHNLKYLAIDTLNKVKKLPDLKFNNRLTRISIKMVNFDNFENILSAKNLEEIVISNPKTFDRELDFILQLKKLKSVILGNYTAGLNSYLIENGINTKSEISEAMRKLSYVHDL